MMHLLPAMHVFSPLPHQRKTVMDWMLVVVKFGEWLQLERGRTVGSSERGNASLISRGRVSERARRDWAVLGIVYY